MLASKHKKTMHVKDKIKSLHRRAHFSIQFPQGSLSLPKAEFDFQPQTTLDSHSKPDEEPQKSARIRKSLCNGAISTDICRPLSQFSKCPKTKTPCSTFQQQKDNFNEAVKGTEGNRRSIFSNYVLKLSVNSKEQRKEDLSKQKSGILKEIMQSTSSENSHINNAIAPPSFCKSKFAPVKDPLPLKCKPGRVYSHGLYKPRPLLSSQKLTEKVEAHKKFVNNINSILTDKERDLFTLFENSRINLLKHSEWFKDAEGQKSVYLMLTELEEQWLQAFVKSELNTLTKEKNRLEEELRRQPPKEESK